MIRKFTYTLTILFVLFGMLGVAAPAYAQTANPGSPIRALKGVIAAINTKTHTLTIARLHGAPIQVIVSKGTLIKRNGRLGKIGKLHVGDTTRLRYNAKSHKATEVDCTPGTYDIHGTIEAVNTVANTITIVPNEGGNSVMLSVDSSTTIQRNSAAAGLADLVVTDLVEATYNSASMLASDIQAQTNSVEILGTIAAVDTTANTITITPASNNLKKSGDNANVMLGVDSTTTIERNGASASLSDLVVGDTVDAMYNSVTLMASDIKAGTIGSEVQGTISAIDTGANTVTITPGSASLKKSFLKKSDADVVLNVDDNTVITRNGDSASIWDLQVGDTVDATYDPATMLASQITATNNNAEVQGTISAIDTTAGTVTITPNGDSPIKGCDTDITLTVDAHTVIISGDTVVTLAGLNVGDTVEAQYDSVSLVASLIEANDSLRVK